MYIKKLHTFDVDCVSLYNDFIQALVKVNYDWNRNRNPWYKRITVNHSYLQDVDDDLIWTSEEKKIELYPHETYDVKNINWVFKNTYTADAVQLINEWFLRNNLRITKIKYALLSAQRKIGTHIDKGLKYRYHMPIVSNNNVIITCNGYSYTMEDIGCLYQMQTNVPHCVENNSAENRLLLTFDAIKI